MTSPSTTDPAPAFEVPDLAVVPDDGAAFGGTLVASTDLGWTDVLLHFHPPGGPPGSSGLPDLDGGPRLTTSKSAIEVDLPSESGYRAWRFSDPGVAMWMNPHGRRFAVAFEADSFAAEETPGGSPTALLPVLFAPSRLGVNADRLTECLRQWTPKVEALTETYTRICQPSEGDMFDPPPVSASAAIVDLGLAGAGLDRAEVGRDLVARYGGNAGSRLAWWQAQGYSLALVRRYTDLLPYDHTEQALHHEVVEAGMNTLVDWLDGHHPELVGLPRKVVAEFFFTPILRSRTPSGATDATVWTPTLVRQMWDLGLQVPQWWDLMRRARDRDTTTNPPRPDGPPIEEPLSVQDYIAAWAEVMPLAAAVWFVADRMPLSQATEVYTQGGFSSQTFETLWALEDRADPRTARTEDWIAGLEVMIDRDTARCQPPAHGAGGVVDGGLIGDPYPDGLGPRWQLVGLHDTGDLVGSQYGA